MLVCGRERSGPSSIAERKLEDGQDVAGLNVAVKPFQRVDQIRLGCKTVLMRVGFIQFGKRLVADGANVERTDTGWRGFLAMIADHE